MTDWNRRDSFSFAAADFRCLLIPFDPDESAGGRLPIWEVEHPSSYFLSFMAINLKVLPQ